MLQFHSMKINFKLSWIAVGLACLALLFSGCGRVTLNTQQKFLLGTVYEVSFYEKGNRQGRSRSQRAIKKIFDRLQSLDSKLNPLNPVSELSSMNGNASLSYVSISKDVFNLINKAQKAMFATEGAFNITLSPLLELIRVNPNLSPYTLREVRTKIGPNVLDMDPRINNIFYRTDGVKVNLGHIQAGYALDMVADILKDYQIKSAFIQADNVVYATGSRRSLFGSKWRFEVPDPLGSNKTIAKVVVKDQAIAFVSTSEQYYENLSAWRSIVVPKTQGTLPGLASVVKAPNAITAQIFANALVVLGPELAPEYMKQFPNYEYVIFYQDKDGKNKTVGTENFKKQIRWGS